MAVLAVLIGLTLGSAALLFHQYQLRESLTGLLVQNMERQAENDRALFDRFVKGFSQATKLLHGFRLIDYLDAMEAGPWQDAPEIRYHRLPPPWFPDRSLTRVFIQAGFAVLLDGDNRVREIYSKWDVVLPAPFLEPGSLIYRLSKDQSYLFVVGDLPYLVASRDIPGEDGAPRAVVALITPIDYTFLNAVYDPHPGHGVIAVVTAGTPHRVIGSNQPDRVPAHSTLQQLEDEYLVFHDNYFNYGNSELLLEIATLVPRQDAEIILAPMIGDAIKTVGLIIAGLTLSFLVLILYVTGHIRALTVRVLRFARDELGIEESLGSGGDEIQVLDAQFRRLMSQVIQARELLRRQSAELTTRIVETSLDGVVSVNSKGEVRSWNTQAEKMFGWNREEAIGRGIGELIIPESQRPATDEALRAFRTHRDDNLPHSRIELTVQRRDGSQFPAELSVSLPTEIDGDVMLSAFVRDITKRRSVERALLEAKAAADEASEIKSRMLAQMSHEFRTPVNGIIGGIELLRLTALNQEQQDYVELQHKSAKDLIVMIDKVLDFSKIETREIRVEKRLFSLPDLLDGTIETLAPQVSEKGLELRLQVAPLVPERLVGDQMKVGQILCNLLQNGLKYTHRGRVDLLVGVEASRGRRVDLRFTVRDTGIGIDGEQLQSIFEPFEQTESYMTRTYGGTGLGLAICARLAVALDGRIWAESTIGEGSHFHLVLPFGLEPAT